MALQIVLNILEGWYWLAIVLPLALIKRSCTCIYRHFKGISDDNQGASLVIGAILMLGLTIAIEMYIGMIMITEYRHSLEMLIESNP